MTHDNSEQSKIRDKSRRIRLSIRQLFLVTGLVALGFAMFIYLTARQRRLAVPSELDCFRAEYPLGSLPYTIGGHDARRLGFWVAESTPVFSRRNLKPVFAIEFFFRDRPDCRVEFQTLAGSDAADEIYFRWENQLRVGSYASLRLIVEQPMKLPVPDERYSNYYSDRDHDGDVDTMYQYDSTNSRAIVWEDTDNNGVFDSEYFTNHGEIRGVPSTIEVLIPANAKRGWAVAR